MREWLSKTTTAFTLWNCVKEIATATKTAETILSATSVARAKVFRDALDHPTMALTSASKIRHRKDLVHPLFLATTATESFLWVGAKETATAMPSVMMA